MESMLHRGSTLRLVGLILLTVATSSACMYDCHNRSATACGGGASADQTFVGIFQDPETYGQFDFPPWDFPPFDWIPNTVDNKPQFTTSWLKAVDLSNKGITSIAPTGLECFNLSSASCTYAFDQAVDESSIQAVLLDGNNLSAIPNMSVFTGACYVSLTNNLIGGALPSNMFAGFSPGNSSALAINLQSNNINGTSTATFGGFVGSFLAVNVQNNNFNLNSLANGTFTGIAGDYAAINIESSNISGTLASNIFSGPGPTQMHVFLQNNLISALSGNVFNGFSNNFLVVHLESNIIGNLEAKTFGFSGEALIVHLFNNNIGMIGDGAMQGVSANTVKIIIGLSYCQISRLGKMFDGFIGACNTVCTFDLEYNQIDGESLKTAINSLSQSSATVILQLKFNNVTILPGYLFAGVGSSQPVAASYWPSLIVNLANNPISSVNSSAFSGTEAINQPGHAYLDTVNFVLDMPTTTSIYFDGPVGFSNVQWKPSTGGNFSISLAAANVDLSFVRTLGFQNHPYVLEVILQSNGYTDIPSGVFSDTVVTGIDLSNNLITQVAIDAFTYNFRVQSLFLPNNRLEVVPIQMLNTLPVLRNFSVSNNRVWAIPQVNSHMKTSQAATQNIIQCSEFGVNTTGCTCPPGYNLTLFCGFWRCTQEPNGCPLDSIFNSSNCVNAPNSQCINASNFPEGQYYDLFARAFLPLANCSTAFGADKPGFQYQAPSHTSNRLCSLCSNCSAQSSVVKSPCTPTSNSECTWCTHCPEFYTTTRECTPTSEVLCTLNCSKKFQNRSWYTIQEQTNYSTLNGLCAPCTTCPPGFDTGSPCTSTSDVLCFKNKQLSAASVAGIVVGVLVPTFGFVLALLYIRYATFRTELGKTKTYLELTEQLLGDERDEKEQMEHAWTIAETDLSFGAVIGEGAFGRVYKGMWGHIEVAIKVLRMPIDELDVTMRADFDREVKFMRSIRSPNLLTFYGAGVDQQCRAFLVTELMLGSLKDVLLDLQRAFDWGTRLRIAEDVSKGMNYLHQRGAVHRDLKADNCFVDAALRVKVADFGTGRIAESLAGQSLRVGTKDDVSIDDDPSTRHERTSSEAWSPIKAWCEGDKSGRTLSIGVGSLLWMAPEALRGSRVKEGQAPALDVYSFAIVMWEIWTRACPWDEIQEEGVHFSVRLSELVSAGVRPSLPNGCAPAPLGYRELMERCWAGRPDSRPTFAQVVIELCMLRENMSETSL